MTAAAYERLLDALRTHGSTVRANGSTATARCPAHDDGNPSLSLRAIEGQALLHCFAGCETTDVLAALGMTMVDLYDDPAGATYAYGDGRRVHRTPDKRFRQSGNTKGTGELYRRMRIETVIASGEFPIHVVEGEKDVHAIESIGGFATCSPMGAGKWHKADPTPLYGGNVVVVADRDEPGEKHARDIVDSLNGKVASIRVVHAKVGKDAADHVAAGYGLDDFEPYELGDSTPVLRQVRLTAASTISVRPVHWLWTGRLALGTLALLGGREGVGKSTVGYQLAADVTRGRLEGRHLGSPRSVIVAATEDSWAHTIVPRLMAAGADLDKVFRVDVTTPLGVDTGLSLPRDLVGLADAVRRVEAAMILLDPLMSRLDTKLDSHKDAEVRIALEPLVKLADDTATAIIGLIHVNKTTSTDPLTTLMASRAFAAVARSVLFVMVDPDDDAIRLLGQPKNNLGRADLPTLTFTIGSAHVADTDEGPVWTGRLHWVGERDGSIRDALEAAGETADVRSATGEAVLWLREYLAAVGGTDDSATVKAEGRKADHSPDALKRARARIKAVVTAEGFPRRTFWTLARAAAQSEQDSGRSHGETHLTALTTPTGHKGRGTCPVGAVGAVVGAPARDAPTGHDAYEPPVDVEQSITLTIPSDPYGDPAEDDGHGDTTETDDTATFDHCPDCHHETAGPPGKSCDTPDLHPTGVLL